MTALLRCPNGHEWTAAAGAREQERAAGDVCPACGLAPTGPGPTEAFSPAAPSPETVTFSPPDSRSEEGTVPAPPRVPGYEVLGELGRGGMGVVYRAGDTALARDVAVKVLQDRFAPDSASARRFVEEARITAQLQHPGIPAVHQVGSLPDGRPFLVMKLIKGRTLDDLLKEVTDPAADRGRFLAVFEQIAQAVGYAHSRGVMHRDLKPANVMVGAFGEVQVMDWGLAKVLGDGKQSPPPCPGAETLGTEIRSLRDS